MRDEFSSFNDFLAAVVRHGRKLSAVLDPRLQMQLAVSGMGSQNGPGGGFLIGEEFAQGIWEKAHRVGRLLPRCTRQPITSKAGTLRLPAINEKSRLAGSRYGGISLAWLSEAEEFPQSQPGFGEINFTPKKIGGVIVASDEMLEDSPALGAFFERMSASELSFNIEEAVVNGSGVGQPFGILRSPALITVSKQSGQPADTIVRENLVAMVKRLWAGSVASAIWIVGIDAFAALLDLQTEAGVPLVTYISGQRYLLGFPIEVVEYSSALGDAGDIILADLSQYLVSEREAGTKFLGSIHVRFIHDETAFRLVSRVDGAPAWSSPVTVKNAALPVSPFITLEERA